MPWIEIDDNSGNEINCNISVEGHALKTLARVEIPGVDGVVFDEIVRK